MTNKVTKYGLMTIAAVLLVAMAFAGAASAAEISINATTWNGYGDSIPTLNEDTTYKISGLPTDIIYPKFNGSTGFTPGYNVTLDFADYGGRFYGDNTTSLQGIGAVFGYIDLTSVMVKRTITIQNLKLMNVVVNSTSGGVVGGIVGCINGSEKSLIFLNFTNCYIKNSSITGTSSGGDRVGGLVGRVNKATINADNCKVGYCDVVSYGDYAGGMVGFASTARLLNCDVKNSVVASITGIRAGGFVGSATDDSFENCSNKNTFVYGGSEEVGGLCGFTSKEVNKIENCTVINCVVTSGSYDVGGLVGKLKTASGIGNCCVKNSTIMGSYNVGGLVGRVTSSASPEVGEYNSVEYSAVNGTGKSKTQLVCGTGNNLNCTADLATNFIYNTTYKDTITLYNITTGGVKQPITSLDPSVVGPTFWKTIFNATGYSSSKFGNNVVQVTYLGKYGTEGGYGVGSAPKYIATPGDVQNGTLNPVPNQAGEGILITVTTTPNSGYYVNWTYYNKTNDITSPKIQFMQAFLMPAYDVNISGDFKANITNVTFFNLTVPIESKLNTYKESTNATSSVPTRIGYTFAGWNVSSEDGTPFNSTGYNESGTWNFTGPHYTGGIEGNLGIYANWTANTYTVHFDANGGVGSMDNMTFTYDEGQNLTANAFQRYNSNFLYWTYNGTKYYDTEFVQNLTPNQGYTVELVAQWETYSTSGSKNTGYSVILQDTGDAADTATNMYTVNFTMNGHGIQVMNQSVSFGNTADEPSPVSTADGYTFTGWYTDKGLVSKYAFSTPVTDDIELYAGWATKDAKIPTSKSPAPFVGMLAGLGAAAVLLRLRK